jgi:hypothetical protein
VPQSVVIAKPVFYYATLCYYQRLPVLHGLFVAYQFTNILPLQTQSWSNTVSDCTFHTVVASRTQYSSCTPLPITWGHLWPMALDYSQWLQAWWYQVCTTCSLSAPGLTASAHPKEPTDCAAWQGYAPSLCKLLPHVDWIVPRLKNVLFWRSSIVGKQQMIMSFHLVSLILFITTLTPVCFLRIIRSCGRMWLCTVFCPGVKRLPSD